MGDLGEKYFKRISPYIENIVKAKGTIICKRANKLIDSLKAEFMEYYDETEDDVIETITHRALCRAFKRACLCYIAEGQKWDSALDTWIRWSFMYDMWMQFHYFYDAIVGHNGKLQVTKKGPDPILLGLMPGDCITFGQIKQRYKELGKETDEKQIRSTIRAWINRGKLERTDRDDVYRLAQKQHSNVA